MKYQSKPRFVEAFKWTGDEHQTEDPIRIVDAFTEGVAKILRDGDGKVHLSIDGELAKPGDYVVKLPSLSGEDYIYISRAERFECEFEPVKE